MARTATLPVLNGESGLSRYLAEIRKFPMLEPQQEYMLAKRWREHDDRDAAHHLVTSHLRLVAKIAMGYRGYGLPISEVVSEGNVGLMQAGKRFEPEKGFRVAASARCWSKGSFRQGAERRHRRAERPGTPHLRGAAPGGRSDDAGRPRRRIRRVARARAADRGPRLREGAVGRERHDCPAGTGRAGSRALISRHEVTRQSRRQRRLFVW